MPHLHRAGVQIYFEEHGTGYPFVFSHGLGGNAGRIIELVRDQPGVRVAVYDNRGHGRSYPLGDPELLNFADMADDVAGLLDHLRIERAVVGGVSMGAGIALCCAVRHPRRVAGLVLQRPAWLDSPYPHNLGFTQPLASCIEKLGPEAGLAQFRSSPWFARLCEESPDAALSLLGVLQEWSAEYLVACYRAIPASAPVQSLSELRRLEIPALVVGNRDDPVHPFEYAEALADAIPGAELRETAPKFPDPALHTAEFRQTVSQFLRKHRLIQSD